MQLFLNDTLFAGIAAGPVTGNNGMLFACWAIVIVLLAVAFVFLRSRRKNFAIAILPLLLVPAVHIFSRVFAGLLSRFLPLTWADLRIMIDLTAGLLSCLLLGLASRQIGEKRVRLAFFWCCAGFVVILTLVLVTDALISQHI